MAVTLVYSVSFNKLEPEPGLYRMGTSEEMAAVAAFLVTDDSSYITGETIVANGGQSSRL